ncbi:MAG: protein-glutamate O-methyltransferase CheR [Desulfobacterales bacterium]|nr:protein-glutamate O-methyltransferase CheR [Desulfobacterales bacterium]
MPKISPAEIKLLSDYIYKISGIFLDPSKGYLLEARIGPLVQEQGCADFRALQQKARADLSRRLEKKIIDAISTNETLFFRDSSPFQALQHRILPDLIDARASTSIGSRSTTIRVWSAACSTGQEVYSIAITLKEILPDLRRYNIKLLGTDISGAAVARASSGAYNQFEIERGLAKNKLHRYFHMEGNRWKIKDEIRAMASFRKFNLMAPFAGLGKFDIVFCRNVAIYFTREDREKLFEKIADILAPDGCLVIGSTESLTGVTNRFVPKRHLKSIFYQLK